MLKRRGRWVALFNEARSYSKYKVMTHRLFWAGLYALFRVRHLRVSGRPPQALGIFISSPCAGIVGSEFFLIDSGSHHADRGIYVSMAPAGVAHPV